MPRYAEFPVEGGGTVVVEVDGRAGPADWTTGDRPTTRGLGGGEVITRAEATFGETMSRIQPVASGLIASLRATLDPPDAVDIEFGIQMSADLGAFIAKASAEANFKVALHWKTKAPG
jgi:hypothetical protein